MQTIVILGTGGTIAGTSADPADHTGYTPAQRSLRVSVQDDGCGLPSTLRPGRGLSNMRHRAREVGGTLTVAATHPGTCVSLEMTIADEAPQGSALGHVAGSPKG